MFEPVPTSSSTSRTPTLDVSLAHGAYEGLRKAVTMQPGQVIDAVKASGLRGRGGAGFPAGMKWGFVPKNSPKPKYVVLQRRRERARARSRTTC